MPEWSEADLAYLAGFLDGEGSICVFRYRIPHGRGEGSALRVCAYNTNEEVLRWIELQFGGKTRKVKRRPSNRRQSFVWEISAQGAVKIIRACLPFFKIKKQQAELFLLVAQSLRKHGGHAPLTAEIIQFRNSAAKRMTELNKGIADAS